MHLYHLYSSQLAVLCSVFPWDTCATKQRTKRMQSLCGYSSMPRWLVNKRYLCVQSVDNIWKNKGNATTPPKTNSQSGTGKSDNCAIEIFMTYINSLLHGCILLKLAVISCFLGCHCRHAALFILNRFLYFVRFYLNVV